MIHEALIVIYRLIVLFVLGCVLWNLFDEDNDLSTQIIAVLLSIPLLLRVLMIK